MTLHPDAAALLQALIDARVPALDTMTPEEARALRRAQLARWDLPRDPNLTVEDSSLPGPAGEIPIRIYTPKIETPPYPALIYYHGGGWVLGDLDTYDHVCAMLASAARCMVVSVAYRLAPEHPFPAGLEDTDASMQWLLAGAATLRIDGTRIAVGGDSAGANLLTVACHLARDRGARLPICQILIYPVTMPLGSTESQTAFSDGYFLTARSMIWFFNHYSSTPDALQNPLIFPQLIDDLRGMPPALIVTAEYDPLRDEGEAYAKRLKEAGVPVIRTRYPGMIHGFLSLLPPLGPREDLVQEVAAYLQAAFRRAD